MKETSFLNQTDSLKNELIDKILLTGTSIGFAVFLVSLFPFDSSVINLDLMFDIGGVGALFITYFFRKRISAAGKTNMIIAMIYVLVVSDLLENGLFTPDTTLIVIVPFLSILIYNFRITISIYSFCVITIVFIGSLFNSGIITSPGFDPEGISILRWIEQVLVLSVVTFVITLFLNKYNITVNTLISDLKNQNEALAEREHLLAKVLNNFPRSFLSVIDRNLKIVSIGGEEFLNGEFKEEDFIGKPVQELFRESYGKEAFKIIEAYEATFNNNPQEFEVKLSNKYFQFKTMPLFTSDGIIHSIVSVTENITERIESQKMIEENLNEKNVLLQEIHHRVKNNLAVVSGLLQLQSFKISDSRTKFILGKSTNRILSIAKVHEMLYEAKNFNKIPFKKYIEELAQMILSSMNDEGKNINIQININVNYLNINHGVPLGIIFNELITNSVKYGFTEQEGNSIFISVEPDQKDIRVIYMDNGIGIDDFESATSKSLGFTLIESLMHQIEAEFIYDTKDRFKLSFTFPANSESGSFPLSR